VKLTIMNGAFAPNDERRSAGESFG
jgi:hypothetical protein